MHNHVRQATGLVQGTSRSTVGGTVTTHDRSNVLWLRRSSHCHSAAAIQQPDGLLNNYYCDCQSTHRSITIAAGLGVSPVCRCVGVSVCRTGVYDCVCGCGCAYYSWKNIVGCVWKCVGIMGSGAWGGYRHEAEKEIGAICNMPCHIFSPENNNNHHQIQSSYQWTRSRKHGVPDDASRRGRASAKLVRSFMWRWSSSTGSIAL